MYNQTRYRSMVGAKTCSPFYKKGELAGYHIVARDITDRIELEKSLKQEKTKSGKQPSL